MVLHVVRRCRPVLSFLSHRSFHLSLPAAKAKVLYDGECPLCVAEINLLRKYANKEEKIQFVDITKGIYNPNEHLGISYEEAMGNMHVIGDDNKVYKKMDGIRAMYRGVGLGILASFTELPGIKIVADKMYDVFAANRFRLTGRQECTKQCKRDRKEHVHEEVQQKQS